MMVTVPYILENIYRHRQEGSGREAAKFGTAEEYGGNSLYPDYNSGVFTYSLCTGLPQIFLTICFDNLFFLVCVSFSCFKFYTHAVL